MINEKSLKNLDLTIKPDINTTKKLSNKRSEYRDFRLLSIISSIPFLYELRKELRDD